jgi:hypothetical protein
MLLQSLGVKRLFAIVILNIFLLNVLGYYAVLLGLKITSSEELTARLNSDMYDLGAKVTFKVPLAVPYGTDSENYLPAGGQFENEGEIYRIVKQRLHKDILYIECIKDESTTRINDALTDFVQSFAGQDDDSQQKTPAPGFIKDYMNIEIAVTQDNGGWVNEMTRSTESRYFFDSYQATIIHPPDRA